MQTNKHTGSIDQLMVEYAIATKGIERLKQEIQCHGFRSFQINKDGFPPYWNVQVPFCIEYENIPKDKSALSRAIFNRMAIQPTIKSKNEINCHQHQRNILTWIPVDHCTYVKPNEDRAKYFVESRFFDKEALLAILAEIKK